MCEEYKVHGELAKENPNALEPLGNPHGFSSNPGFISPIAHTGAMTHGTRPQQSVVSSGQTLGRTASRGFGSINPATPGSVDPGMDQGPMTVTSGYSG